MKIPWKSKKSACAVTSTEYNPEKVDHSQSKPFSGNYKLPSIKI